MTTIEMMEFGISPLNPYEKLFDHPDSPGNQLFDRIGQIFHRSPEAHPGGSESKKNEVDERFETVETALEIIGTAVEWGEYVKAIEHFSASVMEYLQDFNVPVQLIFIAKETQDIALHVLGKSEDKDAKISKIAQLCFSIVSRFSKILTGMQAMGLLTPAVATFLRFSVIGAICVLIGTVIELGDNILHYTTAVKLLLAILKFAVAALAVYLVFHISAILHSLSLILMSGTLILSVASRSS